MNLDAWNLFKRIQNRLPDYNKNPAGKTIAMVTPDKALTLTATNTMTPGETTWDKVTGKPLMFPTTWTMIQDRPHLFGGSYAELADKPTLFSGNYSDLAGVPQQFSGQYADLQGLPPLFDGKWTSIIGKPAFFSGSYNDLTDKPSIPGAPAMPNLSSVATTGRYSDLTGKPTLFSGSYNDLTDKPTISAQRRIDTYAGKTDTNGLYTVTYPTPFPAAPSIQPEPPAMPNQVWVKVNSTLTGFSLRLVQRNTVNLLNIEVLLGATVNVANADARVVVIAA